MIDFWHFDRAAQVGSELVTVQARRFDAGTTRLKRV